MPETRGSPQAGTLPRARGFVSDAAPPHTAYSPETITESFSARGGVHADRIRP